MAHRTTNVRFTICIRSWMIQFIDGVWEITINIMSILMVKTNICNIAWIQLTLLRPSSWFISQEISNNVIYFMENM
jgi:hypothetical protein